VSVGCCNRATAHGFTGLDKGMHDIDQDLSIPVTRFRFPDELCWIPCHGRLDLSLFISTEVRFVHSAQPSASSARYETTKKISVEPLAIAPPTPWDSTSLRLPPARSYCSAVTSKSVWPTSLALSIVGPGRVGASLAHWATEMGSTLRQVAARRADTAQQLVSELGGCASSIEELCTEDDDLLLVTVTDSAISSVAQTLSHRRQARVVLHSSGRLDASALACLRDRGSAVGTLHPLMAFPGVSKTVQDARDVVFGVDGDPDATDLATCIARGVGGTAVRVDSDIRPLYHLGATLAAGGVVTLLAAACELARRLGVDPEVGDGYLRLAQGALEKAASSDSFADAITGPVARGEIAEYEEQISRLRSLDPDLAEIAEKLARRSEILLRRTD